MKKLVALILAVCCALPLVACGGGSTPNGPGGSGSFVPQYNIQKDNQTVINFTFYGGGMYGEWAEKLSDDFARIYQDTSFGNNKKGVYVNITNPLPSTFTNLGSSDQHIITYTSDTTSPSELKDSGEDLYNLDAIVKDDTSREGGSIDSKLFSSIKPSLQNGGNYYGLPYLEYYCGFSYNRGLFSEVGALFADESDETAMEYKSKYSNNTYYMTNDSGVLAKGPDGKSGTEDDGLPASLEELLVVMQYLKEETDKAKLYPIIVSEGCKNYSNSIARALWTSLAGVEQMRNFYNSKGEVEVVVRDTTGEIQFENENIFPGINYIKKPRTKKVILNDENGYLGADMVARFYAFSFIEIMQRETGFLAVDRGSNTDVQLALMTGSTVRGYKDAAMLIDYSYAYNELLNSGNLLLLPNGKTEADYDMRYMASPTSFYTEEEQPEREVTMEVGSSYYMVVNNTVTREADVEAAVKAMIQYFYSEKNLQYVTKETGMSFALEYGLDTMDRTGMSGYASHILDLRKANGANLLYRGGDSQGYLNNKANLSTKQFVKSTGKTNVYAGILADKTVKFFNDSQFKATSWNK